MVERRVHVEPAPEGELRLDDLVTAPRWVAWREEERNNKDGTILKTKIPYCPVSDNIERQARIPTDPGTWGTREQAEQRWRQLDDGRPGGIGIVLGDFDGVCLGGIDLDRCLDPATMEIDEWPGKVLDRLATYSEFSPSGEGVKLIFQCDPKCWQLLPKGTDGEPQATKSFALGEHREMSLARARFYTITGRRVEGFPKTLRFVNIEDIRWFLNVAGPAYQGVQGDKKTGKTGTRPRDESGSGYGFRFLRDRKVEGESYEAACAALKADQGKAGEWARRVDERQLRRAWEAAASVVILPAGVPLAAAQEFIARRCTDGDTCLLRHYRGSFLPMDRDALPATSRRGLGPRPLQLPE